MNEANKDILRDQILSTNYYLTQAVIMSKIKDIEHLRGELNRLTDLYIKELLKDEF